MYSDKFVVAIKAGGKILRETKDLVHLPFGSEFSVLVKNLNSRRAKFTLHIDGTDVLDGEEIIVGANAEVEMKRFIRNGNMDTGNAFKFIERTKSIEDGPRGIKMDDGVVRVEFWFEKQAEVVVTTTHHHHDIWWDDYYRTRRTFTSYPYNGPYYGSLSNTIATTTLGSHTSFSNESGGGTKRAMAGGEVKTSGMMKGIASNAAQAVNSIVASAAASISGDQTSYNAATFGTPTMDSFTPEPEAQMEVDVNEAGITVPGSKVDQKFTPVYGFKAEEISNVIIIRMAGKTGETPIAVAVTVKAKQKCTTCGHMNKANAKFCSECGTGLELL